MSKWGENDAVIDQPAQSEWGVSDPEVPLGLARVEEEKAQMLQHARGKMAAGAGAYLPKALASVGGVGGNAVARNALATAVGLGSSVVAPAARLIGQDQSGGYLDPDRLNRFGDAYEQAAREKDQKGVVPPILMRTIRGAAKTLPVSIVAGT